MNTASKENHQNHTYCNLNEAPRTFIYTGPIISYSNVSRPIEHPKSSPTMSTPTTSTTSTPNKDESSQSKNNENVFKSKMLYHQCILDGGNEEYCKQFIIKVKNE